MSRDASIVSAVTKILLNINIYGDPTTISSKPDKVPRFESLKASRILSRSVLSFLRRRALMIGKVCGMLKVDGCTPSEHWSIGLEPVRIWASS